MGEKATTVEAYLEGLAPERRAAIAAVREVILAKLPAGYEECMEFGMISYCVPLARYPKTYNKRPLMLASLGSQKGHMAVYLMSIYADEAERAWFEEEYRRSGKKLDAGKACVRFKTLDALPVELIGRAIARVGVDGYLARYEAAQRG
ncbi:MAG: DUF1801 domain-containing protein [Deltaproteobacteria bacterium]|nr:DUF1801 domain-containing protein [Myxococcales bacterium]MDP3221157.1 DUF1801 domain-containing protein [Deltaproteobacteria bacterium]